MFTQPYARLFRSAMIHRYKLNGYNIVLDVYSGSVHVVDDVAYDMIGMYTEKSEEEIVRQIQSTYPNITQKEILECMEDIAGLKNAGKLFSKDMYEGVAEHLVKREPILKALCLHVAHTCDLNCSYCFASQGKYSGERALMSFDVGKRALDFLVENSGSRRNLEVDFFGGEPLCNWEVVKELVAYARSIEQEAGKNFRFTLTTNGMQINDEVIEFANREMHNVVLSLDGRREVHDRFRVDHAGLGSYDRILPKFKKFVAAREEKGYYMRGTFTHLNTDFTEDILHMADQGFDQLSMEPVVCSPEDPCALTEADLPILYRQYEKLAVEMIQRKKEGRGFTFYHYMIDLGHGPCIYKRIAGCGSGTEYLAVTPWGELYPCHQFVGDPAYSMGNIWDGIKNRELQEKFGKCNAYSRPQCQDCWAKLYCSGGCAANAYHTSGDIEGIYEYGCKLFKKRMECAIMVKAAEAEMCEEE